MKFPVEYRSDKNRFVGKITRVKVRGRVMFCSTYMDDKCVVNSHFTTDIDEADCIMRNNGYTR